MRVRVDRGADAIYLDLRDREMLNVSRVGM